MFRFWYRFVFPNISAITAGLGEEVYKNEVEPELNAYMGLIFEEICKQWLFKQAKRNALPFFVGNLGRWWGTNPATKTQEEIDIMATRKDQALFAECKWTKTLVGADVYHDLKRKSALFHHKDAFLYIFAKSEFTKDLLKISHEQDSVSLFSLADMID
jgi:hypothetical protein